MAKQKKSPLVIIFLSVFLFLVGFGMAIPIIPILAREMGATPSLVGLLLAAYSLMQFLFAPVWGRLSDRYGRRTILLLCLVGEGISYLVFALARNLELLFLARLMGGLFGGSISTASAYISDITGPEERSKGMGLIGAAFGIGFIIGPALGGVLAWWGKEISDAPFFATSFASFWVAAFCFSNFVFAFLALPESKAPGAKSEKRKSRLKNLTSSLGRPVVGSLMLSFFFSSFAMAMMEATLILLMGDRFQWELEQVNMGFVYIGLITAFAQGFLVRRLLPRYGERLLMLLGLGFMGVSLLGIAASYSIAAMGLVMTILAFGYSFTNPSTLGSISVLSAKEEQGVVLGTTQSLSSLGRILGPALGGFAYGKFGMSSPFLLGGVFAFLAFAIVLALGAKIPNSAKR